MKVLHVLSGREVAGIRTYVLSVSQELVKREIELYFVFMREGVLFDDLRKKGFRVYLIKKRFRFDLSIIFRLVNFIRKERIDVIHTHNVTSNFYGRLACLFSRRGYVITTIHADVYHEHLSSFKSKIIGFIISRTDLYMTGLSHRLLPISEHLRNKLMENGVKREKINTILSGSVVSDVERAPSIRKNNTLKGIEMGPDEKVVGTVGRLVPLKNHRMFIDAARKVLEKGLKVKFLIIGDGILLDDLKSYVKSLNLSDQIIFTGWLNNLEDVYPLMSIYVTCPTSEGFGLTPLEAMRYSIPVVATRVGGLTEIIKDGENGILIESNDVSGLADEILYLLNNPQKSIEIGLEGRRFLAAEFPISKTAEKIYEVYKSVVGGTMSNI